MKYQRVYHMLVEHGHHPQFAQKIIIDATRGDEFSLRWIRRARGMMPNSDWIARKNRLLELSNRSVK